ncbi:hypothetical protein CO110_04540 [Candidatus Desantisbacteria bacterium CG_4_9_14_3_um_filter_40_11]|uniref:Apea-like HEPN domain-containing protein n=1 Tax=Candidatus Desantisbacteria bacterium CG_4_9_14_3_um_filter_40_11 TaxID=1974546 RepID=A0A2M8ATZ3_9BACT|nr:MAG: hypothetical protein CO110_04540 [Candidatus Desantisbacteria bacterium CG_4_9_14_3_um_filter_40_11]
MANKVTKLKQKLHSESMAKTYPRIERENCALSDEHLTDEMAPYCPTNMGDIVYVVTKESPFEGYHLLEELDLQTILPFFNTLLIYRIFKLSYGQPDILGALSELDLIKKTFKAQPVEWGYILKIMDNLFAEIRSSNMNTRLKLKYWIKSVPKNKDEKKLAIRKMQGFFSAFEDSIKKNAHLFNEEKEIDDQTESDAAILNIFSERYRSAEALLIMAQEGDILPDRRDLEFGEAPKVNTGGSIYLSSSILFVIALESLINTLYHLLLRPEFQAEPYERVTARADLDIRLISAHLFCEGFNAPILTPHSELWGRLLKLRQFRNDMIHGNITSDHVVYSFLEDKITFFYGPTTDFRGYKAEDKAARKYPTSMAHVNKDIVSEIKETVDLIIRAIIDAATDEHREWINKWIWEAMIPKFIKPRRLG